MESLDENPNKKQWETAFNTKVTPALEEMETQIQSSIDVMSKYYTEKIHLLDNPSPAEAITLEKNCNNQFSKVTTLKNHTIAKITS